MNDLQARKKALAVESDVYRELLKFEIQNLRIYSLKAKQRFYSFNVLDSFLKFALPAAGGFFSKQRGFSWKRIAGVTLAGWQTYSRVRPLMQGLFGRKK
jgi:hypothetical protein